jgi:hypothetical protein
MGHACRKTHYYQLARNLDWLTTAVEAGLIFFLLQMVIFVLMVGRTRRA